MSATAVETSVGSVEVLRDGDDVVIAVNDIFDGYYADMTLSPDDAVQLSRALVKAAAEALGVSS